MMPCRPEILLSSMSHHTLAQASENLALLFIHNSVREIYFRIREAFTLMFDYPADKKTLYRRILEAAQQGDETVAAYCCSELIEDGNRRLWSWYQSLDPESGSGG